MVKEIVGKTEKSKMAKKDGARNSKSDDILIDITDSNKVGQGSNINQPKKKLVKTG